PPVAEPHRPLGPAQAGGEPLHSRELQPVFFKPRIECTYRRIGVIGRRPPALSVGRYIVHVRFSLLRSLWTNLLSLETCDRKLFATHEERNATYFDDGSLGRNRHELAETAAADLSGPRAVRHQAAARSRQGRDVQGGGPVRPRAMRGDLRG